MINCPIKQRMDLGECPKIHDLALRADYEQASKRKDYYYDIDVSSMIFFKINQSLYCSNIYFV